MHFHRRPELGLEKHGTSARIASELGALDYEIHKICGTGVVGALARADIEALLDTENTGSDYGSTVQGVMHACGRDTYIATLFGSTMILAEHQESCSSTQIALFQPAEDTVVSKSPANHSLFFAPVISSTFETGTCPGFWPRWPTWVREPQTRRAALGQQRVEQPAQRKAPDTDGGGNHRQRRKGKLGGDAPEAAHLPEARAVGVGEGDGAGDGDRRRHELGRGVPATVAEPWAPRMIKAIRNPAKINGMPTDCRLLLHHTIAFGCLRR